MVHSRVNKWSTFCFEFSEARVGHLLALDFVLMFFGSFIFFSKISFSLQIIKNQRRKMWTTY